MSGKEVRGRYTREFKLEAVSAGEAGQAIAVVAKVLGILTGSLGSWVRQSNSRMCRSVLPRITCPTRLDLTDKPL